MGNNIDYSTTMNVLLLSVLAYVTFQTCFCQNIVFCNDSIPKPGFVIFFIFPELLCIFSMHAINDIPLFDY